jgi:hypothetical protein
VHVAEEYFAGETFYGWVSRLWAITLSREEFLALNAIGIMAMTGAAAIVNTTPARWPFATLGFLTAFNGTLHVVASIVTRSYSPGTVSGLLIWIPLGAYTLTRVYRELTPSQFGAAITIGVVAHALLSLAAFNS